MILRFPIYVFLLVSDCSASTFFVLAGGAGTHAGTDWSNANCKIPPLAAGDVVYIGNSGGNLADTTTPCAGELTHTFSTSGTAGSHITIKAATGADHGTATGWNASFGVDVTPNILWSNSFVATDGLKNPFWDMCGNYYDVDGQVGTSDTTGTYGFHFVSSGRMFGFIRIDSHACSEASLSHITLAHIELDGVEAAGSAVLGTGTLNTDGTTTVTWATDASGSPRSQFDTSGFWSGKQITINAVVRTISSVTDATHLILTSSPTTASGLAYAASQSGSTAFYFGSPSTTTPTVTTISLKHSFVHDIQVLVQSAGNVTGFTVSNDWIENNFSDAAQHSNAIQTQAPANDSTKTGLSNLTVVSSTFKNIQGTGFITCLNGLCDSWLVYNNIFYYTSDWDSVCTHLGDTSSTCGVSKGIGDNGPTGVLTNSVFYGNTFSGIHLAPGHPGADVAGVRITLAASTGNTVQNNLWWNCTAGDIFSNADISHDYNTWLNTGEGPTTVAAHEFQVGTAPGGVGVNPFVSATDFHLTSETVDAHLNDGITLSAPYNVDLAGVSRTFDGTWERGAFEFSTGIAAGASSVLGGTAVMGGNSKR
ncbi:MAG TPA: hypothetical protein VFF39_19710 [Verrucomicrobiae bacterium]|nr:hypothetical protein [Verrucomicrobiae bacterium]